MKANVENVEKIASYFVARWRNADGCRVAVVREGRTQLHLCVQDFPVHVVTIPKTDIDALTRLDGYPVARAARKMLAFGKHDNATKAAVAHLRKALS